MNTLNGFQKGAQEAHAAAAGELCHDDGSGACVVCAVALVPCASCGGTGYHRVGCVESDATVEEGDQAQPAAAPEERRAALAWMSEHGEADPAAALAAVRRGGPDRVARYGART